MLPELRHHLLFIFLNIVATFTHHRHHIEQQLPHPGRPSFHTHLLIMATVTMFTLTLPWIGIRWAHRRELPTVDATR
jgi:hypothetical protein